MPPIIRLLLIIGVLGSAILGGMMALVHLVEPQQRDISQPVPPSIFNK